METPKSPPPTPVLNPNLLPEGQLVTTRIGNRFSISVFPGAARLVFGEEVQAGCPTNWHTAVVVNPENLEALRGLIVQVLEALKGLAPPPAGTLPN